MGWRHLKHVWLWTAEVRYDLPKRAGGISRESKGDANRHKYIIYEIVFLIKVMESETEQTTEWVEKDTTIDLNTSKEVI